MRVSVAKFLLFFLLCWLVVAESAVAGGDHLPIVFEDYPPYEYVEEGEVKGMNMEIIREAFRRMGIKPYFEPRPWKRAVLQLKNGEILALSSGFMTEERKKFVEYPSTPLCMETNMVIVRAGSGLVINSLDNLRPLRLGVVQGYVYGEPFDSMTGLNKIMAKSSHQLLRMILEGRVDAVVGNMAVFTYLAGKQDRLNEIDFIYEVSSEPLYLMFSKAQGPRAMKLARAFSIAVKGMIKDGTFAVIQAKY